MARIDFEPWEPEETIGKLWHSFASRLDAPEAHEEAGVDLSEVGGRLAVLFRGLGGNPSLRPMTTHSLLSRSSLWICFNVWHPHCKLAKRKRLSLWRG